MNRTLYYESLKKLARDTRAAYGLTSPRVLLSDVRRVLRDQDVKVQLWPLPHAPKRMRTLRGAYFNDEEQGSWVMVSRHLPMEQRIFTLAHELKHHLEDRDRGSLHCLGERAVEPIEVGAEIFAAEFIFPEEEFSAALLEAGVAHGRCDDESIIHLKERSRTTLSYTSLAKRAEFLGFAPLGSLRDVRWRKRAEEILGEPLYKRVRRIQSRRDLARA